MGDPERLQFGTLALKRLARQATNTYTLPQWANTRGSCQSPRVDASYCHDLVAYVKVFQGQTELLRGLRWRLEIGMELLAKRREAATQTLKQAKPACRRGVESCHVRVQSLILTEEDSICRLCVAPARV